MKKVYALLVLTLAGQVFAATEQSEKADAVLEPDPIEVVGQQKISADDEELEFLNNELSNVKNLKQGYKKKSAVLNKLNNEAEGLTKDFSEYASKRKKYDSLLSEYKAKQDCMMGKKASADCKFENSNSFLKQFNLLMLQNKGQFQACYDKAISKDPDVKGDISFQFSFMPSGKIDHIGVVEDMAKQNRTMVRCIYQNILRINFPETGKSEKLVVSKKLIFTVSKKVNSSIL